MIRKILIFSKIVSHRVNTLTQEINLKLVFRLFFIRSDAPKSEMEKHLSSFCYRENNNLYATNNGPIGRSFNGKDSNSSRKRSSSGALKADTPPVSIHFELVRQISMISTKSYQIITVYAIKGFYVLEQSSLGRIEFTSSKKILNLFNFEINLIVYLFIFSVIHQITRIGNFRFITKFKYTGCNECNR